MYILPRRYRVLPSMMMSRMMMRQICGS